MSDQADRMIADIQADKTPYSEQIEWEEGEVFDEDIDGHGTNEVAMNGTCSTPCGLYEYKAIGTHEYPYQNKPVVDESTIEMTSFTAHDLEGE